MGNFLKTIFPARASLARAGLTRLMGRWCGFTGLIATTGGSCPCCGAPACPTAFGAAGLLGAVGALLMSRLRWVQRPTSQEEQFHSHQA